MIAIIKYNAGNVTSVQNAVKRLGYDTVITDDKAVILAAEKVIFPGVGEASSAMEYLRKKSLDQTIHSITRPFLGICLGLQLMCKNTEEGKTECLGIFDTTVQLFPPDEKVPHIGWNNFETLGGELMSGVKMNDDVYYVHSYFAGLSKYTIATCHYIKSFSAVLQKDNFYATQFHPEKSAKVGERILKNFLQL